MTTMTAATKKELAAAQQRVAESGTEMHGMLLEAMKVLGTEKLDPKSHRIRLNAQLLVACAALIVIRDFLALGAIKFEVPDVFALANWARQGLIAEVCRAGGHKDDYAGDFALLFDWLGKDRFAGLFKTLEAAELLVKADKAKEKADRAVQGVKGLRQRYQTAATP